MSDRNAAEPKREDRQWKERTNRRLTGLERSTARPSATRVGECGRTLFNGGVHTPIEPTDAFWVYHLMIEIDLDPGSWLVQGVIQLELLYELIADQIGGQLCFATIFSRPLGTDTKTEVRTFKKAPMAEPYNEGFVSAPGHNWFDSIVVPCRVMSDTGLTVSLEVKMEVNGGDPSIDPGTDFWAGPGVLIATPL